MDEQTKLISIGKTNLILSLLAGILLSFPLVVIIYYAVNGLNEQIEFTQLEVDGVKYHDALKNVMVEAQKLRGIQYAYRVGGVVTIESVMVQLDVLKRKLGAMSVINDYIGEKLKVYDNWVLLDERFSLIFDRELKGHSSNNEFEIYSELIAALSDIMYDVGDYSNLATDPELDTHYLMSILVNVVPTALEEIGSIRGIVSGQLYIESSPFKWDNDVRVGLANLFSRLKMNGETFIYFLKRTSMINNDVHDKLVEHEYKVVEKTDVFLSSFEKLLLSNNHGNGDYTSPESFFQLGTAASNVYVSLYDKASILLVELLNERISEFQKIKSLIIIFSVVAFGGVVSIFAFIYKNASKVNQAEVITLVRASELIQRQVKDTEFQDRLTKDVEEKDRLNKQMQEYTDSLEEARFQQQDINKKLEAEKIRIKAIMDNILDGIIVIDKHGIIQSVNPYAEKILGYNAGEMVGENVTIIIPTSFREAHKKGLREYLSTGKECILGKNVEVMGLRKCGEEFPLSLSVTGIGIDGQSVFIGLLRDITEQKDRENQLKKETLRAEEAANAKSEFLANMSHELRTPLNSILGITGLLLEADSEDDPVDMLSTVYRSSKSLLEIVNDILDLSKIEAGGFALEEIPFDMKKIVSSVNEILAPMASEKGISFSANIKTHNFPYLQGDSTRVMRILMNLAGNALKYTEDGLVDLSVSHKSIKNDKVMISCLITDTGIGIAKDKLDLIFEKFSQADLSTTRKFGGTGLGLSITRQLVEMMGGKVGVESKVGKGSTFWIEIPFKVADKLIDDEKVINNKLIEKKRVSNRIKSTEAKVLIAEDHPLNQVFIMKLLTRIGFNDPDLAEDGIVALKALKEKDYDLVLMDCHMPEKNGYDTTEALRRIEKKTGNHVPVIAMTANVMRGDREKCLDHGMDDYISKPVSKVELVDCLSRWFILPEKIKGKKITKVKEKTSEEILPPIDISFIHNFSEGDRDMEIECINLFITSMRESIKKLEKICVSNDASLEWSEISHKMKGGAANMSATFLRDLCETGEAMPNDATAIERENMLRDIKKAFTDIEEFFAHEGYSNLNLK